MLSWNDFSAKMFNGPPSSLLFGVSLRSNI
jgi:hypothetical protein